MGLEGWRSGCPEPRDRRNGDRRRWDERARGGADLLDAGFSGVAEPGLKELDVVVRVGELEELGEADEHRHVELRGAGGRQVVLRPWSDQRLLHAYEPMPRGGKAARAAHVGEVPRSHVKVCTATPGVSACS